MARFREGDTVEVFVPDVDAKRRILPSWEPAIFVDLTDAGFVRVRMAGRKIGTTILRAFSPNDIRKPQR